MGATEAVSSIAQEDWRDVSVSIVHGNCAEVELPANWFHCICTSPPYWLLRDYKTTPVKWPKIKYYPMPGLRPITIPEYECELGQEPTENL